MIGKSSSIVFASITLVLLAATIGYITNQGHVHQGLSAPCQGRAQTCLTTCSPAALMRFQKFFQSDDQQDGHTQINNAMSLYKNTVKAIPKVSNTLLRLSNVYAKRANHDDAIAAYKAAAALNPSNPTSFLVQGFGHQENGCVSCSNKKRATACCNSWFEPTIIRMA